MLHATDGISGKAVCGAQTAAGVTGPKSMGLWLSQRLEEQQVIHPSDLLTKLLGQRTGKFVAFRE